jgi:hypothetical protein
VPGTPVIEVFVDKGGERIGFRVAQIESPAHFSVDLKFLDLGFNRRGHAYWIEISTTENQIFEQFYALAVYVADLIQLQGMNTKDALIAGIDRFSELVQTEQQTSEEKIVGLWGELWLLQQIFQMHGLVAIDMWTGPKGEAHDFRYGKLEIEVKTTRGSTRSHIINSLTQLDPSINCVLYLASIQTKIAGPNDGFSVSSFTKEFLDLIPNPYRESFLSSLDAVGYNDMNPTSLATRYELRSQPAVTEVDSTFPRLTHNLFNIILPAQVLPRLSEVRYRIDVTGLGESLDDQFIKKFID